MAPSEFTHALAIVDERLRTAYTVAASLMSYACLALGGRARGRTGSRLSSARAPCWPCSAGWARWRRHACSSGSAREIYDEIVLSGYRHVGGAAIARHSADLISPGRRRMLADTLERLLEFAVRRQVAAVPLNRAAMRELEPHLRGLCARLRAVDIAVEPAGMVLLRRLLTDGATSPLFKAHGPVQGARARDRAHPRLLGPMPVIQLRPAAADRAAAARRLDYAGLSASAIRRSSSGTAARRLGRLTTMPSCVLRASTTTASSSGEGFSSRCGTHGGTYT